MVDAFAPLTFTRGPAMKNRIALAPLTNRQSNEDGTLSDEELHWLSMRAQGGFGLTMTCAAHVQENGKGFLDQLGVFNDKHLDGLTRLAASIKKHDSLAIVQLHHAGIRSPKELIPGQPVGPSRHTETGSRALTTDEVKTLVADFIAAAVRCEKAGFHGVELHGAHNYIICQFLSPEYNSRNDEYGGNAENRARILWEIITGIRQQCSPNFSLSVRLSPERYGLRMQEMLDLAKSLMASGQIDFLDMSLWDVFKEPEDQNFKGKSLLHWFANLPRHDVRFGIAGNIRTPADVTAVLEAGVDFVVIGRAAIVHHDFPDRMKADPNFQPLSFPVSKEILSAEGVSKKFLDYLSLMSGLVTKG